MVDLFQLQLCLLDIDQKGIPMTTKLYYEDSHQTTFQGIVEACKELDDGCYDIILDRTAFFPEEGGQSADTGILGGFPVLDVQIKSDVIHHKLSAPLSPGETVTGNVDWSARFDYMQQHSGEHILSGLVNSHYGFNNVGFHLGKEEVTLDFDGVLSLEELRELELKANHAISLNLPIQITFPSKEELSVLSYRSKIALEKDVRIVAIPGYDVCACCAPHVDSSGQIGIIKITSVMKHRGGIRVTILCGFRALRDYTMKQDNVTAISNLLSVKPDMVSKGVVKLQEDFLKQKQRFISVQENFLDCKIKEIPPQQNNVFIFLEDIDTKAMRNGVNTLCTIHSGYCGIFIGCDETGYQYILGSSSYDCKKVAQHFQTVFQSRGGGSSNMIQGTVLATKEALTNIDFESISGFPGQ